MVLFPSGHGDVEGPLVVVVDETVTVPLVTELEEERLRED